MNPDHERIDLAAERLGAEALYATDDFFAPKENLLKAAPAVWIEDKYTDRGKWMDGWESRRRRTIGHDWCTVRLGLPGVVRHVVVDTAFFKGNYPEECSIEGCVGNPEHATWHDVLPRSPLQGDSQNHFDVQSPYRFTHLRLHIYPDGGVARLRVFGDGVPDWMEPGHVPDELDLAAVENGGKVVGCSDMFFGSRHNLIMPGHATHMGDGWETRRRRGPGNDWVVVELGTVGEIESIDFDTSHFKGNAPGQVSMEACMLPPGGSVAQAEWRELLRKTAVSPNRLHRFHRQLHPIGEVSHVRVNVFPDGGVARLRLYGVATWEGKMRAGLRWMNTQMAEDVEGAFRRCCGSDAWVQAMVAGRPYQTLAELYSAAGSNWWALDQQEWLEAFSTHPAIGAKATSGHQDHTGVGWSEKEQAGLQGAATAVTDALTEVNHLYRERFGYTYIVCATGRTADEMLADVNARLSNSPGQEAKVAAGEQSKITRLRLEKMLLG